jgi:hypothetical protein
VNSLLSGAGTGESKIASAPRVRLAWGFWAFPASRALGAWTLSGWHRAKSVRVRPVRQREAARKIPPQRHRGTEIPRPPTHWTHLRNLSREAQKQIVCASRRDPSTAERHVDRHADISVPLCLCGESFSDAKHVRRRRKGCASRGLAGANAILRGHCSPRRRRLQKSSRPDRRVRDGHSAGGDRSRSRYSQCQRARRARRTAFGTKHERSGQKSQAPKAPKGPKKGSTARAKDQRFQGLRRRSRQRPPKNTPRSTTGAAGREPRPAVFVPTGVRVQCFLRGFLAAFFGFFALCGAFDACAS